MALCRRLSSALPYANGIRFYAEAIGKGDHSSSFADLGEGLQGLNLWLTLEEAKWHPVCTITPFRRRCLIPVRLARKS